MSGVLRPGTEESLLKVATSRGHNARRSLIRRLLLFRPTPPLGRCDPFASLCAEGPLPPWSVHRASDLAVTSEQFADLFECGKFGIDRGEKVGCIHAG